MTHDRRVALVLACIIALLGFMACSTSTRNLRPPRSTRPVRVVIWNGWRYLDPAQVRNQDLDYYRSIGVGGVVTSGVDLFDAPTPGLFAALASFVRRMHARGMKVYCSYSASDPHLGVSPFGDWFDDATWARILSRATAGAKLCHSAGADGFAQDGEAYQGQGDYWDWDRYGSAHTEAQVRAEVKLRGSQLMTALVAGFPNLDLRSYYDKFDGGADAILQHIVNGAPMDNYSKRTVFADFWAGMSSSPGWSAIRFYDSVFYLGWAAGRGPDPYYNHDDLTAMRDNASAVTATLSKFMRNIAHVYVEPMIWAGPTNGDGGYFTTHAMNAQTAKAVMTDAHNATRGNEIGVFQYSEDFPLNISFTHFTNKVRTIVDNDYGPAYHAGAWGS